MSTARETAPKPSRRARWWGSPGLLGHLRRVPPALAVGVLVVATLATLGLTGLRTDTTAASFLPVGDPAITELDDSARSFGGDPIVVLAESAQPGTLLGPDQLSKLVGLEGDLARLPDVAVVYGPGTLLNQIAGSAQNLLATLSGRRDAILTATEDQARAEGASADAVKERGNRAVAAFDERYGTLLVRGLPAGLPTLHNPAFVNTVVFDSTGDTRPQWRFVVPSPNAIAILIRPRQDLDQTGTDRLVQAARASVEHSGLATSRLTVSGTPVVAAELGATVQREIPLLGALALGLIGACYLLMGWTRRRRHRLLPLAATLSATALVLAAFGWLGRPLSLGVVAFLPILVGIGSDFPAYVVHGVSRRRVVVAALASTAGFASLAFSPMPFVRDLGLALAAGVLVALGATLVFRRHLSIDPEADRTVVVAPAPRAPARLRVPVLIAVAAVAALGWVALPQLNVTARPDQLAAGLPAVDDALHAESVLGSSGEVQVLLSGPNVVTPEALAWMRQAEDTVVLRHGSELSPIVSMPDLLQFLGIAPTSEQITAAMKLLPPYLSGAVVRPDGTRAVISLGLGLGLQDISRQMVLLDGLRAELPPPPPGMQAEVVGLPVVAARGYELISEGRYLGNLIGIAAAGLVLAVGLKRRSDALRAVLAASLATGWSLALAWTLGISLSPLTVALGSLATATACEFTVLLTVDSGRRTIQRTVGVAAAAATLGYLALAASDLSLIRQFGLLLAATMVLSLVAAHTVVRLLPPRTHTDRSDPTTDGAALLAPLSHESTEVTV
jgi:predicted RND superfamily exporter protein